MTRRTAEPGVRAFFDGTCPVCDQPIVRNTSRIAHRRCHDRLPAHVRGALDGWANHWGDAPAITLYHYTCDHAHEHIFRNIIPAADQTPRAKGGPGDLAWFTDLAVPVRDALGLTSHIITCDRTRHRYRVTGLRNVVPWTQVRRQYPWAAELESAPGARPRHWFVSTVGVPVIYDPLDLSTPPGQQDPA